MPSNEATRILTRIDGGDDSDASRLMTLVYDELRSLACVMLAHERPGHMLQPTALVHEAYLRLVDQTQVTGRSRNHFFAVASQMMRRVLIDHARGRATAKRGGECQRITLVEDVAMNGRRLHEQQIDLLALDEALKFLATRNQRQERVVELRFFGGLSVDDTAAVLEVSPRTVKDDWRFARAWLRARLEE